MTENFTDRVKSAVCAAIISAKGDEKYILDRYSYNENIAEYYRDLVLRIIRSYNVYKQCFDGYAIKTSMALRQFGKHDEVMMDTVLRFTFSYREDGTPICTVSFDYEKEGDRIIKPKFQSEEAYNEEMVQKNLAQDEITVHKSETGETISFNAQPLIDETDDYIKKCNPKARIYIRINVDNQV